MSLPSWASITLSCIEAQELDVNEGIAFHYAYSAFLSHTWQDLFKGFARHLSHLLAADKSSFRKTGELPNKGQGEG